MTTTSARTAKRRRTTDPPVTAAGTIPDDLLISEVLVRLPVMSLMRVKFVCRSWRAAIEDPDFIRRHLERSRSVSPPTLLVIPREDDPDEDSVSKNVSFHRLLLDEKRQPGTGDVELMFGKTLLPTDHEGVTMTNAIVPTHCDGLIALATPTGQVFVCNPATREFVALPPSTGHDDRGIEATAVAIGYDSWRNSYVVARYFYRSYNECNEKGLLHYDIGHEIFTLGSEDDSWVPTADPPHAIGPSRPICTRNAFYWCTHNLQPEKNALLRFGLRDRAFDVVPFPPGTKFFYGVNHVAELDGKLCYVNTATDTAFDVWVASDDDGTRLPEWSLRCRVDFSFFASSVGAEAMIPVAVQGDEMLLAADYRTLYSYDTRWNSVVQVLDMEDELEYDLANGQEPCSGDLVHHVVPYVESLVPITSKQRMRKT